MGLGNNLSVAEENPSRNERISSGDNLECSLVEKRLDLDQKTWVRFPAFLKKKELQTPFFYYTISNNGIPSIRANIVDPISQCSSPFSKIYD